MLLVADCIGISASNFNDLVEVWLELLEIAVGPSLDPGRVGHGLQLRPPLLERGRNARVKVDGVGRLLD